MKNKFSYKKVLYFFAHPDDETLSAGGTIHKMRRFNIDVKIVIASKGLSSRSIPRKSESENHIKDLKEACSILGIKKNNVLIGDFKDNAFDSEPLLNLAKFFKKILKDYNPDAVFTHHKYCTNIDHKYCFEAALLATRQLDGLLIDLFSCETLSSTSFNRPNQFDPNFFSILLKEDIEAKKKAIGKFRYENRKFPHMRSKKFIDISAQYRGAQIGTNYAEAFSINNLFN